MVNIVLPYNVINERLVRVELFIVYHSHLEVLLIVRVIVCVIV